MLPTSAPATRLFHTPSVYPAWADRFLEHYARTGLLASSADAVGVTTRQVNALRARNPDFEDAFDEAHDLATDVLEREARRRALTGAPKGVYYKGERVAIEHVPSDVLMKEMLKAKRPEFRDKIEHTGLNGAPLTLTIRTFDADGNEITREHDLRPQPLDVTPTAPDADDPDPDDPTEGLA